MPTFVVRDRQIPNRSRSGDLALQRLSYRSAGACPPQSLDLREKRPQPKDYGRLLLRPGHGEGQALALRW